MGSEAPATDGATMTSRPIVSVVIPSYNHRRFLERTMESALGQTFSSLEVIVVDDGSADGSAEFLRSRYGSDARVRIVARENRGAHATINEAIGLARGDYVAILNSDDAFAPTRLSRLHAMAVAKGGPFFGFTAVRVVDETGAPAPGSEPHRYYSSVCAKARDHAAGPYAYLWFGNATMTTSNFFFGRDVFERVGPFRGLRYTHDWDWALRASEVAGVVRLEEPLLDYRVHGTNTIHESNVWKHATEDAFVFGSALGRIGLAGFAERAHCTPVEVMSALLRNESLPPVATLYVAGLGLGPEALERELLDGRLERALEALVETHGHTFDLLQSGEWLENRLVRTRALEHEARRHGPISRRIARAARRIASRIIPSR